VGLSPAAVIIGYLEYRILEFSAGVSRAAVGQRRPLAVSEFAAAKRTWTLHDAPRGAAAAHLDSMAPA